MTEEQKELMERVAALESISSRHSQEITQLSNYAGKLEAALMMLISSEISEATALAKLYTQAEAKANLILTLGGWEPK